MTTYNELLSVDEIEEIGKQLNFESDHVISCIIQEFDTQFEFSRKIRYEFIHYSNQIIIMIIIMIIIFLFSGKHFKCPEILKLC